MEEGVGVQDTGSMTDPQRMPTQAGGVQAANQSTSLPGSPFVRPRAAATSRSPPRTPQIPPSRISTYQSPRTTNDNGCQFQRPLKIRRRMSYSLGNEPLEKATGPIKERLDADQDTRLGVAISSLYISLMPSEALKDRRTQFLANLETKLSNKWPSHGIKLQVFGSSANNLSTADSDGGLVLQDSYVTTLTLSQWTFV